MVSVDCRAANLTASRASSRPEDHHRKHEGRQLFTTAASLKTRAVP